MHTALARPKTMLQTSECTTLEFMTGPSSKGPKRCLHCHKPFKKGEAWQRHTSPADRTYGAYTIGIHTKCLK